ncbi:MAG: LLM class F420-dependent oxidoreductase, partial [Thermoleophilia bacterium]|nr:LLM class F420-dependent oxidoreductase [Thermoleophilia bacterium]
MELGRVGVWLGQLGLRPAAEEREAARELEALGYGALWFGESPLNREAFAHAGLLLAATGAAALAEAYPGRFVLGLGVSHAPLVARIGREYR